MRQCWQALFAAAPAALFTAEEIFVAGDRAVVRWTYRWAARYRHCTGHIRGVDIMRALDGKIAEKLSYVKG